jgi:hypothetical protein
MLIALGHQTKTKKYWPRWADLDENPLAQQHADTAMEFSCESGITNIEMRPIRLIRSG